MLLDLERYSVNKVFTSQHEDPSEEGWRSELCDPSTGKQRQSPEQVSDTGELQMYAVMSHPMWELELNSYPQREHHCHGNHKFRIDRMSSSLWGTVHPLHSVLGFPGADMNDNSEKLSALLDTSKHIYILLLAPGKTHRRMVGGKSSLPAF
ncbi:hypothetical protein STEG23_007524, partial [Scotinomys teguina]